MAEYISHQDDNENALDVIRKTRNKQEDLPLSLSDILMTNTTNDRERVYQWSYLAVRFLFEEHPEVVSEIKSCFRSADDDCYQNYITSETVKRHNNSFSDWIYTVEPYILPLVLSASGDHKRESFVRVVNRSNTDGEVNIIGRPVVRISVHETEKVRGLKHGPVKLFIPTRGGASHFNSTDLRDGNSRKGLMDPLVSVGDKNWYFGLNSEDIDFYASSYIRLRNDGFVAGMSKRIDSEYESDTYNYFVPIFNPASNMNQRSFVIVFNPNEGLARVRITGIDDKGNKGDHELGLSLYGKESIILDSQDAEMGTGVLDGWLGAGTGKWRLEISSTAVIDVINLIQSPTGHLSNLSQSGDELSNERMFLPHSEKRHGFIRIINHDDEQGSVRVSVTDDLSSISRDINLSINALEAKHFNSYDLQNGNPKRQVPALGAPEGKWRLKFNSALDISVFSYMRSENGFLNSVDGVLSNDGNNQYTAWFFNPASNTKQRSLLRFINSNDSSVTVSIHGTDDKGMSGAGVVSFELPAGAVKTINSIDLEEGNTDEGLTGSFGDRGTGKWRLEIQTSEPLQIMNLLESPNGYISNLSTP